MAGELPMINQRFPVRAVCIACDHPVLVVESRENSGFGLMFDPEPGAGDHYDTVLTEDLARVAGSGEATAIDCKGRLPLFRPHPWSCPRRLECPGGQFGLWGELASSRRCTMSDDRATTALGEIRGRHDLWNGYSHLDSGFASFANALEASAEDIPRLLAAVERVLELADRWEHPPSPAVAHEVVQGCGQELRQVISAALLGEGADGG